SRRCRRRTTRASPARSPSSRTIPWAARISWSSSARAAPGRWPSNGRTQSRAEGRSVPPHDWGQLLMTLTTILAQQLVNGLVLGSFYALVALGYTMVFGVVKLLNFAHGDLYMVGAFTGLLALSAVAGTAGTSWVGVGLSILLAMIAVGFLGVVIERIAYAPMLKAPRLSILITALAVSLVLQNGVLTLSNGQVLAFSPRLGFAGINLGPVFINYKQIALAGTAAVLMIALELFITRTQYGRAMRAVSVDRDMSELMGIDVNRVIAVTFFVGSALAGAAGTMAG